MGELNGGLYKIAGISAIIEFVGHIICAGTASSEIGVVIAALGMLVGIVGLFSSRVVWKELGDILAILPSIVNLVVVNYGGWILYTYV